MHVEFTDEQQALRKVVRDFAATEIAPHADAWDASHTFPVDVVRQMGELGLFGIPFPEEYGGGGSDLTTLCIAIEELARVDQSVAVTLEAGVGLGANPIFRFGNEEQRQRWLPDLCAGRALGGFGLTEPEAGSDAGGIRTTAMLDDAGAEWVVNGAKAFITNSGTDITSLVTITARTGGVPDAERSARPGPERPAAAGGKSGKHVIPEISCIIVPAGTPGLAVEPPYRKMGWHASDTHGLTFTDCRVPVTNLLGERGRGFAQFLQILDEGRIAIAALAVGVIRCCLEQSVAYANERHAFGRPIGANQAVAFACSDLAVMAETAGLLVYQAAWRRDTGKAYKREAAIAKLYATESAVTATRMATQVFGGYGFMDETPVARHYRDAKILEIGEGTSEIQRLVIARDLGLPLE
ncbi:MAG TPA: acyl-CoA dehydrogenase family protein [Acidimicrobiales bacterium]|nr:acyl-CoA dehydrogenase family protein [Acidimicrobiales bacterium]